MIVLPGGQAVYGPGVLPYVAEIPVPADRGGRNGR
jgi:hypothetical protein